MRALIPLLALLTLGACTVRNYILDGGTDSGEPTAALFSHCTQNRDCLTDHTCQDRFPGGLCTHSCNADMGCESGSCATGLHICVPHCAGNSGDCLEFGAACVVTGVPHQACFPTCEVTPADGTARCNDGLICDAYTGLCAASLTTSGRETGDTCANSSECRSGSCIVESHGPTFNGYIGGYCVSGTRRPPLSAFAGDAPLPTVSCPPGSAVFPTNGTEPQDFVNCYRVCDTVAMCRPGYSCDHFTDSRHRPTTNGVCLPINCLVTGALCRSPSTCHIVATGFGLCG